MLSLTRFTPSGRILIPGSKSHTIRALLIASFARGVSKISNPLSSEDTASAISVLTRCGVKFDFDKEKNLLTVDSTNLRLEEDTVLDCGNSGTTLYLCLGLLSTLGIPFILDGDNQLRARPIGPLAAAYGNLGIRYDKDKKGLPMRFSGTLTGGECSIECKTSQYLSSLLLSLPLAKTESRVDCPLLYEKPYVEMTLSWLDRQGIRYERTEDLEHWKVYPGQCYHPFEDFIPGDYSSATFFFVLAAITGTSITVAGLVKEDSQGDKKVLDILEQVGCTVLWNGDEVTVKGPETLKGGHFDLNSIPDSLPALSVMAAFATEPVFLENVANARIKETDRIAVMKENLTTLGVPAFDTPDSLIIHGNGKVKGGFVKGYSDHRIIMAMAILSAAAEETVTIDDEAAAAVTFPTFFTLLNSLKKGE